MRRWPVLLMMLLLPLRSWAGDLMSMQMAAAGAPLAAMAAMPDCPTHMGLQESEAPLASVDMESCSSCELCIPLAELAGIRLEVATFGGHEKPLATPAAFVSASLEQGVRPPIS